MKLCVCASACGLLLLSAGASSAGTFALNEALGVAYETNPQLDAARAGQRSNDEGVNQAHANWRPTVNLNSSYGFETLATGTGQSARPQQTLTAHPLTGGVQLTENIYRGGRTAAEISRAKAIDRAGLQELVLTEEGVLLDAVTAYMNMSRDQTTLGLRRNYVAALQTQLEASEEGFKLGELTRTDVEQSRARLAGAQADLASAQGELEVSRSNFERVIGRPPETLEQNPPMPKVPATQEQAVALASQENPAISEARENVKAADYAVTDAVGALLPSVSLNAQYGLTQDSLDSTEGTGVQHVTSIIGQLTVPIYQGGAEDSVVRQAKNQRAQAEVQLADLQRQAIAETQTAWQALSVARGSIDSYQIQVTSNQQAYEGVKEEQQVGSRTVLDVLNAQQELLNAQIALVGVQRDAEVAAYQVLSAVGALTAKKLALPVKYYDPAKYYKDNATRWFGFGD